MEEARICKRGISTATEIKKLREAFPDESLVPGLFIAYEKFSSIINVNRYLPRWHTVFTQWKKVIEEESGIFVECVRGQGIHICGNSDKLRLSTNKAKSSARFAKRSVQIGAHVERKDLSEDEQKRFDQTVKFSAAVIGLNSIKRTSPELPTLN